MSDEPESLADRIKRLREALKRTRNDEVRRITLHLIRILERKRGNGN